MISVSLLSSYLYCPRKLFLEQVLKLYVPPKEAIVKGIIRHSAYENINRIEESLVKQIDQDTNIESLYKTHYSRILRGSIIASRSQLKRLDIEMPSVFREVWPLLLREMGIRIRSVEGFINKYGVYGEELWDKLIPKIKSEYSVSSETLNLKGKIDQLRVYEDHLLPVELKTGKVPEEGVWPGHSIQIAAYVMLIEENFGVVLNKGIVSYLDSGEEREVPVNPFMRDEVKRVASEVSALLDSLKIPDHTKNENKCNACNLRDRCYDDGFITTEIEKHNRKI